MLACGHARRNAGSRRVAESGPPVLRGWTRRGTRFGSTDQTTNRRDIPAAFSGSPRAAGRTTLGIMEVLVPTPAGEARITRLPAGGRRRATLVLGHGAGGGIDAPDLRALAAALPPGGVEVALVEQPWRVAGKRIAPQPKVLDSGWVPVVEQVRRDAEGAQRGGPGRVPIIVGGRSAGARVACRTGQ